MFNIILAIVAFYCGYLIIDNYLIPGAVLMMGAIVYFVVKLVDMGDEPLEQSKQNKQSKKSNNANVEQDISQQYSAKFVRNPEPKRSKKPKAKPAKRYKKVAGASTAAITAGFYATDQPSGRITSCDDDDFVEVSGDPTHLLNAGIIEIVNDPISDDSWGGVSNSSTDDSWDGFNDPFSTDPFATDTHDSLMDDTAINPATGEMMIGGIGGVDTSGNPYGTDLSGNDDMASSSFDDSFSSSMDSSFDDSSFDSSFDDSFSSSSFDDY